MIYFKGVFDERNSANNVFFFCFCETRNVPRRYHKTKHFSVCGEKGENIIWKKNVLRSRTLAEVNRVCVEQKNYSLLNGPHTRASARRYYYLRVLLKRGSFEIRPNKI